MEMKVYLYKLDRAALDEKRERALELLPAWRIEQYERMRFPEGRLQQLAASLLLRHALWDAARIDLSAVEIRKNEYGKPELFGSEVHFNLTDSGDYVAAIVADAPVGIDLETKNDPDGKIAERFFSPEEVEYIQTAENKDKAFRYLWTRKEAYLKCTGTGISVNLNGVPVLKEAENGTLLSTPILSEEYALSLCVKNLWEAETFPKFSLDTVEGFDI